MHAFLHLEKRLMKTQLVLIKSFTHPNEKIEILRTYVRTYVEKRITKKTKNALKSN